MLIILEFSMYNNHFLREYLLTFKKNLGGLFVP